MAPCTRSSQRYCTRNAACAEVAQAARFLPFREQRRTRDLGGVFFDREATSRIDRTQDRESWCGRRGTLLALSVSGDGENPWRVPRRRSSQDDAVVPLTSARLPQSPLLWTRLEHNKQRCRIPSPARALYSTARAPSPPPPAPLPLLSGSGPPPPTRAADPLLNGSRAPHSRAVALFVTAFTSWIARRLAPKQVVFSLLQPLTPTARVSP
jgi:hypothetical protein